MFSKLFLPLACFLACGRALAMTTANCPSSLTPNKFLKMYDDKCFRFAVTDYQTFDKAQKICQSQKGNLAAVTSARVNNFLQTTFQSLSSSQPRFWIGLKYDTTTGATYYVDGRWTPYYKYENFRVPPIVEQNQCISMSPSDGKWQIDKCSDWSDWEEVQHPYVCEYKA